MVALAYHSARLGTWQLPEDRAAVMGIINLTPDSFSDGGRLQERHALCAYVTKLIEDGADLLDVGAESTRPGATPVADDEQLRRLEPLFALMDEIPVPVSLDTRSGRVARAGIDAGADIVNDVSMGRLDPELPACARERNAVLILMHSRGTPTTMDECADYVDVVSDLKNEWEAARDAAGYAPQDPHVWFDPGLGFAKTAAQGWTVISAIAAGKLSPAPVTVVGASRKRMTAFGDRPPGRRDPATHAICARLGAPGIVHRVHDVDGAAQAVRVARLLDGVQQWS